MHKTKIKLGRLSMWYRQHIINTTKYYKYLGFGISLNRCIRMTYRAVSHFGCFM